MPVQYNSNKIIPAPTIAYSKQFIKLPDGEPVGVLFDITVQGRLLADKGSPSSTGTFWTNSGYPADETVGDSERLKSILRKQEALRGLFSEDGHSFEVQPLDGSAPVKCFPRVLKIDFADGNWYNECFYTISMEADTLLGLINPSGEDSFDQYISEGSESWNLEFDQPENQYQHMAFRLTHNLSAVGRRHYDAGGSTPQAWTQAQSWVQARMGLDITRITASGAMNLPSYMQGYNHVIAETVDEKGGGYSIVESWLVASGTALEDFTVSTQKSIADGLDRVSVQGSIIGMEIRDANFQVTTSKYDSALTKLTDVQNNIYNRANTYGEASGTLNTLPISQSVGTNPVAGTIQYTYEYDTRPPRFFSDAKSEIITLVDNNPTDIFASIGILGRKLGPLLQDIGASGQAVRTLTVELVMPAASSNSFSDWLTAKPDTSSFLTAAKPNASRVFKSEDNESWIPQNGRYTRTVAWTWGN